MLSRVAGRTSRSRMPVVSSILNGCPPQCLVDTGSERTLVSPQVVEGYKVQLGKAVPTADGKASHVKGKCRVIIGLQGHCFGVTAPVMSELGNLGVDCLLGGDAIDHMGVVTVRRGSGSQYVVRWGKPYPKDCFGAPQSERARAIAITGVTKVDQKWPGGDYRSLQVEDPDFTTEFIDGQWIVSWWWSGKSPEGLQTQL